MQSRDQSWSDHDFAKHQLASAMIETSISSKDLCEGAGKFWDSESESEYEDLGDADLLAWQTSKPPSSMAAPPAMTSPRVQPPPVKNQAAASPASPKHYLPPWKRVWKGPLPPCRITPAVTLGDLLRPALEGGAGHGRQCCRREPNSRFQILNCGLFSGGPRPGLSK